MRHLLSLLLFSCGFAHAESFVCQGTGRFAGIISDAISLQWPKGAETTLLDAPKLLVKASLDKSNSDGRHYLELLVLEDNGRGGTRIHSAKGSLKDMVIYTEYDETTSIVVCVPFPH